MAKYFEATILGQKNSQLVVNRLNFTSNNETVETANANGLLQALGYQPGTPVEPLDESFLARLLAAQTVAYQIDEIIVRNLWSVTDFITQPVSDSGWAGTIAVPAGDAIPTFVAAKLRTNRVRTDVRRGTLSLTGGTEEQTEGADVWTSGYMTLLTAVATALNAPPTFTSGGASTQFLPSVFKKERYIVPDSDPVRFAYRYYTDFALFQANIASPVTWSAVERVTSQVSRKIGRGA
jgi:hypothetical protein